MLFTTLKRTVCAYWFSPVGIPVFRRVLAGPRRAAMTTTRIRTRRAGAAMSACWFSAGRGGQVPNIRAPSEHRRIAYTSGSGRTRGGDSDIERGRPDPHGRHSRKVTTRTRRTTALTCRFRFLLGESPPGRASQATTGGRRRVSRRTLGWPEPCRCTRGRRRSAAVR